MHLLNHTVLEIGNGILIYGKKGSWGRKYWEPLNIIYVIWQFVAL